MKLLVISTFFTCLLGATLKRDGAALLRGLKHVDWRPENAKKNFIRDQGKNCRSGYAFAAVAALEGRISSRGYEMRRLSVQNVIDCSRVHGNNGCKGGFLDAAYEYIMKNQGINYESDYPYEGATRNCRFNVDQEVGTLRNYTLHHGEAELKRAVELGPVAVAIDADHPSFVNYTSGIYNDFNCGSNGVNHAVAVVGFGTDHKTRQDYWILQNSWGTNWGEKGYMRILRGFGMCSIGYFVVEPIV